MSELLKIEHLTYKKTRRSILEDLNLTLDSGKTVALLGENGAGKTTLMRIISGIAKNYKGTVSVSGKTDQAHRKAIVSMTDALHGLSDGMKISEVKEFFTLVYPDFKSDEFDDLRKFMNLDDELKLGQLSRGMREKLEIALTLSRKADLYLLDEPFSGIDAMARKRIINSIILWKDEKSTIVISDHFVNEISSILDEVVIIKDKKVVAHSSAEDIRSNGQTLEDYYEGFYNEGSVE